MDSDKVDKKAGKAENGENKAKNPEKKTSAAERSEAHGSRADPSAPEMLETLQRVQAEFENYRKRAERDAEQKADRGSAETIARFLPVADAMDGAMKNLDAERKNALEPIRGQFFGVLKDLGVEEMDVLGKRFDHELHECMMQECNGKHEEGDVLEEFQKGYLLNGRVLRHAKVKVNKK
ncbi:nucleotide exchange factor GrpE [Candidatus Micrarchaeota archaeon]|nr:nucleotide exchange factor GrpE [Candidatus Micrarchaeota archaeon]MBU1939563.1 nucleotide exchange factor GrpE [Candidatus Micrarchaeota archaeon]